MSNARSPREVCSTTMGTSGLTGSPCPTSGWLAGSPKGRLLGRVLVVAGGPQAGAGLGLPVRGGAGELGGTAQGAQDLGAVAGDGLGLELLAQGGLDRGAEVRDGAELAGRGRQLVVERTLVALPDGPQLDRGRGRVAGQRGVVVVVAERDL